MSSGQWEVVSRNKKDKANVQNKKNQVKNNAKKEIPPPKVEDVLPMIQVKKLFTIDGKVISQDKPQPDKDKKPKETAKKQNNKKSEKQQEPPKPKPPKNIESALNNINIKDFEASLEVSRQRFPEAPLLWLKELSGFLNSKINVEVNDPVFSNKAFNYPLCAVPVAIKQVMDRALKAAGKPSVQLFYDISLIAMAGDMAKGQAAVGHKLWLQFLAQGSPQVCVTSLDKHTALRTSYQNRQPVGLSILWGLGQGGFKDLAAGLAVFRSFMRPMLDMKHYCKYVVRYLAALLARHPHAALSTDDYLYLYDVVNGKHSVPHEVALELLALNKPLKAMLLARASGRQLATLFEPTLGHLDGCTKAHPVAEVCDTLVTLLAREPACFGLWQQAYARHLQQSNRLLNYINEHWKKVSTKLDIKLVKKTLKGIVAMNAELSKKAKQDPALKLNVALCEKLTARMTVTRSFPWKFVTFVLFLTFGSLVTYDLVKNGSWKQSHSVRTLKDIGVWGYGELAWDRAHQGLNWTKERIEEYAPGYIETASEVLKPYAELSWDLGLVLYNVGSNVGDVCKTVIIEKTPIVLESIEKYAPGVLEHIAVTLKSLQNGCLRYFDHGYNYLATQVFVGQLSPENMQKYMWQAINTTQQYTVDCYDWISEKIQTLLDGK